MNSMIAGGVISKLVSRKQTIVLHEDETSPFLSNDASAIHLTESCHSDSSAHEKKFINIDGMTCGACSAMIQKLLTGLDGVESCSVSLMLKRAEVIINPTVTNLDDIIEEIEDIGFTASQLFISNTNKNNFVIQLFYDGTNNNKQQILDTLMAIEGVSNVELTTEAIAIAELPTIDMSHASTMVSLPSTFSLKSYGTTEMDFNTARVLQQNIYTMYLRITYDPNSTGMRSVTEWINDSLNTEYKCCIKFDASDISQRKKNIEQSREREMLQWTQLFKYSLLFAVPAFLATMVFPWFSGFEDVFATEFVHGCSIRDFILFLLATPIQFGPPGLLFYRGAFKSLRAGSANMDVLVALATSISYGFSVIQVMICVAHRNTSPSTTFETSAVLITVIILGKYMESIAKGKTSQALDKLMDLAPSVARLVDNFDDDLETQHRVVKIREIDARLIELNDVLEVTRGTKCPVDGVIIRGSSSMDESLITGESMAVHREIGDQVIGATVNLSNTIYIRVNKIGNETVLSKIITLVENAQSSRAPIQKLADRIAGKFVPIVIAISVMVFVGWYIGFETGAIHVDRLFGLNSSQHGTHSSLYYSFLFAISVLVISCPCALGLATPTAVMVATGKAAELGILFKGGEPLEIAGQTNCIVFDKTGTLTQGKMQIVNVIHASDRALHKILKCKDDVTLARAAFWNYIYGAEKQSEHLIATAVCNFIEGIYNGQAVRDGDDVVEIDIEEEEEEEKEEYKLIKRVHKQSISQSETFKHLRASAMGYDFECQHWDPEEFIPHTGSGVTAVYRDGVKVRIGNAQYMATHHICSKQFAKSLLNEEEDEDEEEEEEERKYGGDKYLSIVTQKAAQLEANGNSCVFVAINGALCGILSIADKIKRDAFDVVNHLQNVQNISCYMITGDNEITARAIGKMIGIPQDHIRANVSPQNKQNIVKQLQNTRSMKHNAKSIVTFVGDGINDSPSLAQADIGIAIGAGTDVAIASASVVLMNSKLMDVLNTIDISKATVKRIRLNFGWALVYNACMIPFAAGVLYPFIHYALPPFMAGLLMCLSSISVVCNSLLLKLYSPPKRTKIIQNAHDKRYQSCESQDIDMRMTTLSRSSSPRMKIN
eukprot:166388_1